jgi:uncharacterized membrane protein
MERLSEKISKNKDLIFTIAAIAIVILAAVFWIAIITHAYRTLIYGTEDLAYETYNLYMDIHYTSMVSGLQFLVLSNNLSPDALLVMPIFYLHQSALTLAYLQIVVICITALIIFFAAKKLIKDSFLAFAFCFAFLFNPGIWGLLTFDFHMEFLIIPFYILTFYYYMTSNKKLFVVSLLLLLGTIEVAPLLAITLGLGLFAYEKYLSKGKGIEKGKKSMLAILIVASLIAGCAYFIAIKYLIASYSTSYTQLPAILKITTGHITSLFSSLLASAAHPLQFVHFLFLLYTAPWDLFVLLLSALLVFMAFGFFELYRPKAALLLLLPWFAAVLVEGWTGTVFLIVPSLYGYSYFIGAAFAAAVMGAMSLPANKKNIKRQAINPIVIGGIAVIIIAIMLNFISVAFVSTTPILFVINYGSPIILSQSNATQILQLATLIPKNASLFTEDSIAPHVAQRMQLEFPTSEAQTNSFFVPQYILVSYSTANVYTDNDLGNFGYLISNYSYELYARNGSARLYRKIN